MVVAAARESVWYVGVLCLRNPFRESAERGTQTSEWGKNSVSLPVLHPTFSCSLYPLARPLRTLPFSLSSYVSPQRPPFSSSPRVSLVQLSRLRGNQAEHKLGRHPVAGNIYKAWNEQREEIAEGK